MKRWVAFTIVATMLLASAGTAAAQSYPVVTNLEAFSAATNFMSLAGYLRWVVFQTSGQWLTPEEAQRIVNEQARAAKP